MNTFTKAVAILAAMAIGGCKSAEKNGESKEADVRSEVEVTYDSLPAAVKEGFTREFAGAKVTKVEKETYNNGMVHYEFEFKDAAGKKQDVQLSESGEKLEPHD